MPKNADKESCLFHAEIIRENKISKEAFRLPFPTKNKL